MAVIATTKIFYNGKIGNISNFFGYNESKACLTEFGDVVGNGQIERIVDSEDTVITDIELTGLISGETYTISVDSSSIFYNQDLDEVNLEDLSVGDVIYSVFELMEINSISTGTPSNTRYKIIPEGATENNYHLVESGIIIYN